MRLDRDEAVEGARTSPRSWNMEAGRAERGDLRHARRTFDVTVRTMGVAVPVPSHLVASL